MKSIRKRLIALILLIMVFATIIPVTFADTLVNAKVTGQFCYTKARAMLSMINDFRTGDEAWYWNSDDTTKTVYNVSGGKSLGTLQYDYDLEQIAMERARELAVYYDHTRPNNTSCFTLTYNGISSNGENIAYGFNALETPDEVFVAWREDDEPYGGQGHRRNMLHEDFTAVGFGCFYHQGYYYWAQEFRRSNSGAAYVTPNENETTGYVEYSTDLLGENYWSDELNKPTPPTDIVPDDWMLKKADGGTIGQSNGQAYFIVFSQTGCGNCAYLREDLDVCSWKSDCTIPIVIANISGDDSSTVLAQKNELANKGNGMIFTADDDHAGEQLLWDILMAQDIFSTSTPVCMIIRDSKVIAQWSGFCSADDCKIYLSEAGFIKSSYAAPTINLTNTGDGVQVSWNAVSGAPRYNVYRKTGDSSFTFVGCSNGTNYLDKSGTPGTTYSYRVSIVSADGKTALSPSSTAKSITFYKTGSLTAPVINAAIVDSGIQVSWKAVSGAPRYNVFRRTENGNFVYLGYTTGTSYLDSTVTSGSIYGYRVSIVSPDGKIAISTSSAAKSITYYASGSMTPPIINVANTNAGVKVSWNTVSGAPRYNISRRIGTGEWKYLGKTTDTSYVDTNVVAGTSYSYRVTIVTTDGKTALSTSSMAKSIKYNAPISLAAPSINATAVSNGVQISWNPVSGAPRYNVYRRTGTGSYAYIGYSTGTNYTDRNVVSGTNYSYRVTIVTADGKSALSNSSEAKSAIYYAAGSLTPPTISASLTSSGVQLTWNAVSGAPRYNIFRRTAGGTFVYLGYTAGTSFLDNNVSSGTNYGYRVTIVSPDGKIAMSNSSEAKSVTYYAAGSMPVPSISVENTNGGVQVSWGAINGAPRYNVYRRTGTGSFVYLGYTNGTSYLDKTVASETRYGYRVCIVTSDGKIALSTSSTVKSITTN